MAGLPTFQGVGRATAQGPRHVAPAGVVRRAQTEGPGFGSGLVTIGDLLGRAARGQLETEARQAANAAQAAGQAEGLKAWQEGRAPALRTPDGTITGEAFNAGANVAYAAGLQVDVRNTAARLANQHETPEAFSQAWDAYQTGLLSKVPAELQPELAIELEQRRGLAALAVEEKWTARQRQAQAATMHESLIGLGDDYRGAMRRGDTAAAEGFAVQAQALIDGMVASGHLTGAQAAAAREGLRDDGATQYAMGQFEQVLQSQGLDAAARFMERFGAEAAGDPEWRDRTAATMRSLWGQKRAEQQAALAGVAREVQAAVDVLERGYQVDLGPVMAKAAGTPLAAVVAAAQRDQQYVAALAKEAPEVQAEQIARIDAALNEGKLPAEQADRLIGLRDRLDRTRAAAEKALADDPLAHAAGVGVVQLTGIDWQALGSGDPALGANAVRAAFAGRVAAADTASARFGREVPPLTKAEIAGLAQIIQDSDSQTATLLLGTLRENLPDEHLGRVLEVLAPRVPAFAVAAAISSESAPIKSSIPDGASVAAEILRGTTVRETTDGILPKEATGYLRHIDAELGDAFVEDLSGRTRQQVVEATLNLYAARTYQAGKITDGYDDARLKQALHDVTGGIIEYNGRKIVAPARGMTERDFEAVLDRVTDDHLAAALHPTGRALTADLIRDDAEFTSAGAGRYFVHLNGKKVVRADDPSRAFVLDLRPLLEGPR